MIAASNKLSTIKEKINSCVALKQNSSKPYLFLTSESVASAINPLFIEGWIKINTINNREIIKISIFKNSIILLYVMVKVLSTI